MVDAGTLALVAMAVAALSGVPGLVWRKRGPEIAAVAMALASGFALGAAGWALTLPAPPLVASTSPDLVGAGYLVPRVDALSAVFLAATAIVSAAAALFGAGYWRDAEQSVAPATRLLLGFAVAGIFGVEVATDGISFLVSWEVMAFSAFGLVMTLHRDPTVRSAGWLYLVTTRAATLALIAAFALLVALTGTLALTTLPVGLADTTSGSLLFLLFLVGFGIKAGMFPFHFWLPPAHAAAPGHVSAMMSGVLIKTGIYGLFRFFSLVPDPPLWWGVVVFLLGAASAVLGVIWALGSHDLKRLLAYHSVENIGIILLGLGLAMVGRTLDRPEWVVLGMAGALLHVLNHAIFKSLLFLGAGAVDHACHTRSLDRLGGLAKAMPVTAATFLVGAAAICGLPPFNGFCSEWLIYLGLFQGARGGWALSAIGLTALVLTGGLALACFAKAGGAVFLGEPRSPATAHAHEAGRPERAAMTALASLCLVIGLSLPLLAPLLEAAARAAAPELPADVSSFAASLQPLWVTAVAVAGLLLGLMLWRWLGRRVRASPRAPTWDCGYAAPTARMQYTASSFAAPLTSQLRLILVPEQHLPRLRAREGAPATSRTLFPAYAEFRNHAVDLILDRGITPVASAIGRGIARLHIAQHGRMPIYLAYVVATLVALLLWSQQ